MTDTPKRARALPWLAALAVVTAVVYVVSGFQGEVSAMALARAVVQPWFLDAYIGALVVLTVVKIARCERRVSAEEIDARKLIRVILGGEEPRVRLQQLRVITDPFIVPHTSLSADPSVIRDRGRARGLGDRRAVAAFLTAVTEIPRSRHAAEGFRPAEGFIRSELDRMLPRAAAYSDVIIRLSLIGTFAGLIAALTIASTNLSTGFGHGSGDAARMQGFLQDLLASAAVKFWISAVGLILALVLRSWQSRLDARSSAVAYDIGRALDEALADDRTAAAWCAPEPATLHTVSLQLAEVIDELRRLALPAPQNGAGRTADSSRRP